MVQLRKDNAQGTIYNIVGFQTHLKWPEQKRVFSMIPALRNAEYVRYGVMHRNTFLDSPRLLNRYFRVRTEPRIRFAGQVTGGGGLCGVHCLWVPGRYGALPPSDRERSCQFPQRNSDWGNGSLH